MEDGRRGGSVAMLTPTSRSRLFFGNLGPRA